MSTGESNHAHNVLTSLNHQRASGQFCDATLDVGDGVVHMAHRNVLACFSDLFNDNENLGSEIRLEGCPHDGLELLLNFVYTGELKLDTVNLEKVQSAAARLCVPRALELCQSFSASCTEAVPVKRKRGRPKKALPHTPSVLGRPLKDHPDAHEPRVELSGPLSAAAPKVMAVTRSGRKVRCPRRLPGESCNPTEDSPGTSPPPPVAPAETANRNALIAPGSAHPDPEAQKAEIQMRNILDVPGHDPHQEEAEEEAEAEAEAEEDGGGGTGLVGGATPGLLFLKDSDEEDIPATAKPASVPLASGRRGKAPPKAEEKENGEAQAEGSDPQKPSVVCPVCQKTFRSKYYLKVHNRRHTGEKPFVCSKCGQRYFRKENLLEHENRNCSKVVSFSCRSCPLEFKRKKELRLHMISHTGDMPNKCTTCPQQFMHKRDLNMHMIKIHGFPKPHACKECSKGFLTRTELQVHEAAKHRGEKPFRCEECSHRASSRNGLQMHIKAIHRNERPFVCHHCGHAFTQKTNLTMHLRVHTGERPYQCHLCGKTFRTQASLDKHNRTHTGERPFSCEFCQQRFTEKGPLVRHIASKHQEGRPHCCHICGKTFKALEQLRVHLRRHKGVRKFECNDCGYKFTRQAHLRRHSLIHKRMEHYNPKQRRLRNIIVNKNQEEPSQPLSTPDPGQDQGPDQGQERSSDLGSFVPVAMREADLPVIDNMVSSKTLEGGEEDGGHGGVVPVLGALQQQNPSEPGLYAAEVIEGIAGNLPAPESQC